MVRFFVDFKWKNMLFSNRCQNKETTSATVAFDYHTAVTSASFNRDPEIRLYARFGFTTTNLGIRVWVILSPKIVRRFHRATESKSPNFLQFCMSAIFAQLQTGPVDKIDFFLVQPLCFTTGLPTLSVRRKNRLFCSNKSGVPLCPYWWNLVAFKSVINIAATNSR